MKLTRPLVVLALLPLLLGGCATSNRISVVHPGQTAPSLNPATLQSYATFNELKQDYQIQGMISAGILPLMKNKAEDRENVVRNTAAGLGVNTLVGFKHLIEQYGGYGVSCAILANTGVTPAASAATPPRFLVGVLPVTVKTDKTTEAGHLQARLLTEMHYQLAEKGYYPYGLTGADVAGQSLEAIRPENLRQPLGVEPDFVLKCEIEEVTYLSLQALRMQAVLYDLKLRRTVWEWREGDGVFDPPVVRWGLLEQATSPKKKWFSNDIWASDTPGYPKEEVSKAIKKAAKTLPPAIGCRQL